MKTHTAQALLTSLCLAMHAAAAEVTLAWDPSPELDIQTYCVYSQTNYPHDGWKVQQCTLSNETIITLTNLAPGTRYAFVTTAFNTSGLESDYSNPVCFGTPPLSPVTPPTRLKISTGTNQTVHLRWNTQPGEAYLIKFTPRLEEPQWKEFAVLYSSASFKASIDADASSPQQYWLSEIDGWGSGGQNTLPRNSE